MADTDSLAAAAAELILDEEHNAPKELQPADTELHEATECGANNPVSHATCDMLTCKREVPRADAPPRDEVGARSVITARS